MSPDTTRVSKIIQTFLVWQLIAYSRAQFMPQMPPMPFPGMGMGQPMSPMMSAAPQMQMAPIPPMPMPMPVGLGQPKLPVVVMPYHSKSQDRKKKPRRKSHRNKRKRRRESSESFSSDTDSSCSEDETRRSGRRSGVKRRHQVLTPVISYVTKDGYVVYQKKIKKERAKDWLDLGKNKLPEDQKNLVEDTSAESELSEETMKEIKQRFKKARKKRSRHH